MPSLHQTESTWYFAQFSTPQKGNQKRRVFNNPFLRRYVQANVFLFAIYNTPNKKNEPGLFKTPSRPVTSRILNE